ncbi:MAG: TIGR02449 family protein [Gammaproteobacteria bacterium]|nr:TIGR02449 family protein [Gammaproteobacteria bacterium]
MIELELSQLEQFTQMEGQFDELLKRYARLRDENQQLKSQQALLKAECASLLHKNELATGKIEAMISRLKAMETE